MPNVNHLRYEFLNPNGIFAIFRSSNRKRTLIRTPLLRKMLKMVERRRNSVWTERCEEFSTEGVLTGACKGVGEINLYFNFTTQRSSLRHLILVVVINENCVENSL